MTLFVATEHIGEGGDTGDDAGRKPGPVGVAHAIAPAAAQTLCGKAADALESSWSEPWPGGQGRFALCPRCEAAVRTSGS